MPEVRKVVPEADRKSKIEGAGVVRQHYMPFKGADLHPVIEVPIDLLVYRMTNMRTDVMQLEWTFANGKPATFFTLGQEDPEAQAAQHSFLLELARDNKRNIYERMATIAEQTEPLMVTKTGVVVNGNRRLAAMRDLFQDDPKVYSRFQNVQVAVLPDADESELTALETDLQIAEDLRLPYGWVEEARGLRRQINLLHWDFARAQSHWGKKESELKAILSRLDLAEEYLTYRGKPQHYALVAGDEQAFMTLQKELAADVAAGVDASVIETRKLVTFAVLAQPAGTVSGSTHSYAAKIDDITKRVLANPDVVKETGWTPTVAAGSGAAGAAGTFVMGEPGSSPVDPEATPADPDSAPEDDDPLGGLPAAPAASSVPAAVLKVLKDPAKAKVIAAAAETARDEIGDEARQAKRGTALAKTAQTINAAATNLSLTNAADDTLEGAAIQLVAAMPTIAECLNQIIKERPEVAASIDAAAIAKTLAALSALAATEEK